MEIEPRVVMADGGSNPRDSVVAVATAVVSLVVRTGYLVVDLPVLMWGLELRVGGHSVGRNFLWMI